MKKIKLLSLTTDVVTAAISYRNNIFKKNVRRSFPPHQEDIPGRFAQHMAFMSNYNDDDDDDNNELLDGMVDRQNAFSLISSRDLTSTARHKQSLN